MKKLLIINASARKAYSHSRTLTEVFLQHWANLHRDAAISLRELGSINVPHINEGWITASHTPALDRTAQQQEILAASDAYIEELRDADIIVLGTPMYNWSIPSTLKAYIDQIMRVNETFRVNPDTPAHPYTGLLQHKTLVILVARGGYGYEAGQQNEHLNFQTTYLRTVFNMTGIEDIHIIAVDGTSLDKEALTNNIGHAHQQVQALVEGMKL